MNYLDRVASASIIFHGAYIVMINTITTL
jgi:hypothetical protein